MKTMLALALLCASSATAWAQGTIPKAFQGVWTESPVTCDIYKRDNNYVPNDRSLLKISPYSVAGTTRGKFIRITKFKSVEITDETNPEITVDLSLTKNGLLEEQVTGARASMLYARCK